MSRTSGPGRSEMTFVEGVRSGVDAYGRALDAAGGTQLESLMRDGDRTAVCAAVYLSPPYDLYVPGLPVSRLSINLTRARVSGGLDGEKQRGFEAQRYSLFLTPAGAAVSWRKDSPSRHLNIYFHPDAFDSGNEDAPPFPAERPVFNAKVPGLRNLTAQLVDELGGASLLNAVAADSLARLLLVLLARHLGHAAGRSGTLPTKVLARVREYVAANLAERVLVADLARQAGMAPNRFALSYRELTGQSPHQLVLGMRLEHAVELLRHSKVSLVEVANACGFANQQHLTNTMRRHLGVTPNRYRTQRGSGSA